MTFEISSLEITSVKLLCLIKLVAKRYLSCKECSFLCLEDIYIYIYMYIHLHYIIYFESYGGKAHISCASHFRFFKNK